MRTEKYEAHRRTYLLVFKRWSVGVRVNANEKEETTYTSQNQTSVRMLKVHHDRICACPEVRKDTLRVLLCSIHVADRTEISQHLVVSNPWRAIPIRTRTCVRARSASSVFP